MVVGNGRVVLPMPAPAPCNRVVMVGAGASFVEGFVEVAEAEVSASTWGGGSCSTNYCKLVPPTWVCQSRAWVGGFLGEGHGGPVPGVCCWSPTDRSEVVEELGKAASVMTGLGSTSGSSISMSSGGAVVAGGPSSAESSGGTH